jgi:hypothetical protein
MCFVLPEPPMKSCTSGQRGHISAPTVTIDPDRPKPALSEHHTSTTWVL